MNTRPLVGVAIVVKKNGKCLLLRRTGSHGEGTWALPGGHLEMFETLEHCAKREVKEEVGLEVANVRFLAITEDFHRKEGKHYITIFVTADLKRGEATNRERDRATEMDWFSPKEFPKRLFIPLRRFVKGKSYPPNQKL